MDAYDADVLIYAAAADHPLGQRVRKLLASRPRSDTEPPNAVGSVLLLPELLSKPTRDGRDDELLALAAILGRIDLRPLDVVTAQVSVVVAAKYRLRAADAIHLATAWAAGADRFITNNRRDFPKTIAEINITYPADLPDFPSVL